MSLRYKPLVLVKKRFIDNFAILLWDEAALDRRHAGLITWINKQGMKVYGELISFPRKA